MRGMIHSDEGYVAIKGDPALLIAELTAATVSISQVTGTPTDEILRLVKDAIDKTSGKGTKRATTWRR